MQRSLWTAMAVELLAVGALNCGGSSGGGGKDIAGDVCKKADTCNSLSGISASKCKDLVNTSLQSKTGSAQADAEQALNACLPPQTAPTSAPASTPPARSPG